MTVSLNGRVSSSCGGPKKRKEENEKFREKGGHQGRDGGGGQGRKFISYATRPTVNKSRQPIASLGLALAIVVQSTTESLLPA